MPIEKEISRNNRFLNRTNPVAENPGNKTAAVAETRHTKTKEHPVSQDYPIDPVSLIRRIDQPLQRKIIGDLETIVPRIAVLVVAAYIAAQMLADIASLKIGVVAGLAVDMGTFIYPVTFTLRDLVHKVLGKRNAQALVLAAGVINLLMAAYLMWAAAVPSDPSWGLGNEFSLILAPVWRIVLASIAAEVISELIDTEVYHWFVSRITTRYQWLRVLISNGVSIPTDNLIFSVGAFGWTLPWETVWQIFLFNLILKYGLTLVSLPMIYLIPGKR